MVTKIPRLSIGLPVYNGESHIREAISSLLDQTYEDFELIISDNGSTDKTQQICSEYAEKDSRVKYFRNEKNFGAAWNFNHVFELSSGEFFKWAASDDIIAPEFLTRCVTVLEQTPSILLCHSKTGKINQFGEVVGEYNFELINDSEKPHERFREMLNRKGFPWIIFGVFRTNALKKTTGFGDYIGSDWNLLAEISLLGRIVQIPECYFFRRDHSGSYTTKHYGKFIDVIDYRSESRWWTGNETSNLIVLPYWNHCFEFFRSVNKAKMSWFEKKLCYDEILRWILMDGKNLMKWDISNELQLWRIAINNRTSKKQD